MSTHSVIDVTCDLAPNGSWIVTAATRDESDCEAEVICEMEFGDSEVAARFADNLAKSLLNAGQAKKTIVFVDGDETACYISSILRQRSQKSTSPHGRCTSTQCIENDLDPDIESCLKGC